MTSVVVPVLVVTLLLPGLAMLFAVMIRYLVRGAPPRERPREGAGDKPDE